MSKRVSNKKGRQRVGPARSRPVLGYHRTQGITNLEQRRAELLKRNPGDKTEREGYTVADVLRGITAKLKAVMPKKAMRRHQGK